jgi:hypothetical protein
MKILTTHDLDLKNPATRPFKAITTDKVNLTKELTKEEAAKRYPAGIDRSKEAKPMITSAWLDDQRRLKEREKAAAQVKADRPAKKRKKR